MRLLGNSLIVVSFLIEGFLAGIFVLWTSFRGYPLPGWPGSEHIILGILLSLPLFFFNYLLFGPLSYKLPALKIFHEFKDSIVRPLAESLDYKSSLFIAICAALGEELFFRGVLQKELGLVIAAFFFSILHFGPAVRHYAIIALLYFFIGLYFGTIVDVYSNIWPAIVAHAFYDYIALLYMKYLYVSPDKIVKDNSSSFINGVRPV